MNFGFGGVELLLLAMFYSGIGLPLGVPPEPEDALLMRVAPEECLYFTTWAGMAKPDGKNGNQTEALLAEREVQRLVAEIDQRLDQGFKAMLGKAGNPGEAAVIEFSPIWLRTLLTRPTAIFVSKLELSRDGPPHVEAGLVVNTGDDTPTLYATLVKFQDAAFKGKVKEVEVVGTKCFRLQVDEDTPEITWGVKGKYLLVGVGKGSMEAIFDNVRKPAPAWLTDLKKKLPVERVSSITYSDLQASITTALAAMGPDGAEAQRIVNTLGLGNVTTYGAVTGLEGDGFISRTLINVEGDARGVLTLVDGKPLTAAELAPIPADANVAVAFRLDADKVIETTMSLAKEIGPDAAEQIDEGLAMANQMLGLDIRKDIAQSLGDAWCVYNSPEEGGTFFTGLTATVAVRDHAGAVKAEKQLLALAEAALRGPDGEEEFDREVPRLKHFEFAGETIHYATMGEMPLALSWCLTESHLIVSLLPQNIQAFLSRGQEYQSIATNESLAPLLAAKAGPLAVTYVDTPKLFEMFYPFGQMMAQAAFNEMAREGVEIDASILPMSQSISRHLRPSVTSIRRTAAGVEFTREQSLPGSSAGSTTPVMVALLLPAVHAARTAAQRVQSTNNLKQIALAMHNHAAAFAELPAAASKTKEGKPGLSWRVKILPFIEQQALYDQFHHDEPWDSAHNKALIEKMPQVYRSPASKAAPGTTTYLGVAGKEGMFPAGGRARRFADVSDGLSNTIMVLEVDDERAVPWTKPEDFEPDGMKINAGLGHAWPGNIFIAAFGDGSVRVISSNVDEKVLQALFSVAGGEVIDDRALDGRPRPAPDAVDRIPEEEFAPVP
jgi:hypothetical protein